MDSYSNNYSFLALFLVIAIAFPLLPLAIARLVAPRKPSPQKQAIYECGLESKGDAWMQFKVQYYIYTLLFVIFDVETAFLYPWAVSFNKLGLFAFVEMILFLAMLAAGLVYAWKKGVLEWK
jgi:NADH:ubiquinone oxidoreductase subunit 3 (subunit A)